MTAPDERSARDWVVVLAAAGIASGTEHRGGAWHVVVDAGDADRALDAVAAYESETIGARGAAEYGRTWAGVVAGVLLVLVDRVVESRATAAALVRAAEARADAIVAGEWWRVVTALTLHADAPHLLSNVLMGAIIATAVCSAVGPGVGAWLLLATGAAGNWVTAMLHGTKHRAVGASTAIFGGLGVLVGLAIVRRPRRAWVPLAAGLALLGFLGTGERADLLAHFFGFVAGIVAGIAVAPVRVLRARPAQWLLALGALGAVGGCWVLALKHGFQR